MSALVVISTNRISLAGLIKAEEWAKFLHTKNKVYTNFDEVVKANNRAPLKIIYTGARGGTARD